MPLPAFSVFIVWQFMLSKFKLYVIKGHFLFSQHACHMTASFHFPLPVHQLFMYVCMYFPQFFISDLTREYFISQYCFLLPSLCLSIKTNKTETERLCSRSDQSHLHKRVNYTNGSALFILIDRKKDVALLNKIE